MKSFGGRASVNRIKKECSKYVNQNLNDIKYQLFAEVVQDNFRQAYAIILFALYMNGYRSKRIKDIHRWVLVALNTREIMGKQITAESCMKFMKYKFGIDFDEIKVNVESKQEFDKR